MLRRMMASATPPPTCLTIMEKKGAMATLNGWECDYDIQLKVVIGADCGESPNMQKSIDVLIGSHMSSIQSQTEDIDDICHPTTDAYSDFDENDFD